MLIDGDLEKTTEASRCPKDGESVWIQYEFAEPQTMRSLTIVTKGVDFDHRDGRRNLKPGEVARGQRRWAELSARW